MIWKRMGFLARGRIAEERREVAVHVLFQRRTGYVQAYRPPRAPAQALPLLAQARRLLIPAQSHQPPAPPQPHQLIPPVPAAANARAAGTARSAGPSTGNRSPGCLRSARRRGGKRREKRALEADVPRR